MPHRLSLLIRAGNPIISVTSADEQRVAAIVSDLADELGRPLYDWSITGGMQRTERGTTATVVNAGKVPPALSYVIESDEKSLYLFRDLGAHCGDPYIQRMVRDLHAACDRHQSTLIATGVDPLPPAVRRFSVPWDLPWPTVEELTDCVKATFRDIKYDSLQKVTAKLSKRQLEQLVQSLRGLNLGEAERVVSMAVHDDYMLDADDLPRIVEAKRTMLGSTGCLEPIAADVAADDIGGLRRLKAWLKQRRGGFSGKAREFGLDTPRGILMLGVQGCGKSLCAKVIAADWTMPLLRLDPSVLYQKFVGETESQLRQALQQAEAMAPVVLWIDEIEKAFASAAASSADGGLSQRMFGTLLSWMQDHRHPIFIVATANDISALPPELMRKGRFDEVFFVDLPDAEARRDIFKVHLQRRKRDPDDFDLKKLSKAADGFSGAEIEQAIVCGLYRAFSANQELNTEHIIKEIGQTQPLSVLMAERVDQLRAWADRRCVPAD